MLLELLEATVLNNESREVLRCVRSSFGKLLDLLNDTLDLAKMDQGKMKPQSVAFETFETILPVIHEYEKRAANNGVRLEVDIEPDMPIAIRGEPHFLARMVTNLLSTAIAYYV